MYFVRNANNNLSIKTCDNYNGMIAGFDFSAQEAIETELLTILHRISVLQEIKHKTNQNRKDIKILHDYLEKILELVDSN